MTIHNKVKEHKSKAAPINYRSLSVNEFGELITDYEGSLAKRVVKGYACRWNEPNMHHEVFIKGAFSKSIRERGPGAGANFEIKFLSHHRDFDPLSLFAVLREDDYGLYFETVPLDDVDSANRVLKQLSSRTLNNFSIGFNYIWDKVEWDDKNEVIVIKECELYEISVVSIPSDMNTYAVRSRENIDSLMDETDEFINELPRKFRLEARKIFARHKALIEAVEPPKPSEGTQQRSKPPRERKRSIDYNFLIQNL